MYLHIFSASLLQFSAVTSDWGVAPNTVPAGPNDEWVKNPPLEGVGGYAYQCLTCE